MHLLPRQHLLSRTLISRSFILHNGKGRPELIFKKFETRSISIGSRKHLSAIGSQCHSLLLKRPSFTQSTIALPTTSRFLSSNASKDPLLVPSSLTTTDGTLLLPEAAATNAWDAHFEEALSSEHLTSVEPHIGYLKELGLDFGWGTTSILQWAVEHVYVYTELPWYGAFLATALIIRIILLPIFRLGADSSGRLASVQHVLRPMKDKMLAAKAQNNHAEMMMVWKESRMIEKRAGIKKWRTFLPLLIQAPLAFGAFRLTRNMVDLPVPGLEHGGALWFTDLTASDPYMIIPVLTSIFLYLGMRRGGEMGTTTPEQQKIMGVVVYLFPALSLAFTSFLPAALTLQFCMTSALSFCQTYVLSSNKARVFLGIYPINRQEPAATGVYEGTITRHPIDATINQPTKLSALASYKKTAQDWMKKRSGEQGKRLNKTERRKADAYEQRRRQELEEEIYHRRQKLLKQEKQKDV